MGPFISFYYPVQKCSDILLLQEYGQGCMGIRLNWGLQSPMPRPKNSINQLAVGSEACIGHGRPFARRCMASSYKSATGHLHQRFGGKNAEEFGTCSDLKIRNKPQETEETALETKDYIQCIDSSSMPSEYSPDGRLHWHEWKSDHLIATRPIWQAERPVKEQTASTMRTARCCKKTNPSTG